MKKGIYLLGLGVLLLLCMDSVSYTHLLPIWEEKIRCSAG